MAAAIIQPINPLASLGRIMGPIARGWRAMLDNKHSKHLSSVYAFDHNGKATLAEEVLSLRQEDGEANEAFLSRVYTAKQLAGARLELSVHDGRTTAKIVTRGPSDVDLLTKQIEALTLQVRALAAQLEHAPDVLAARR